MSYFNTTDDISSVVATNKGFLLIELYADWCGPCKAIMQNIESQPTQSFPNSVTLYKVNVEQEKEFTKDLGVRSVPTFVLFENNNKVDMITSNNLSQITNWVAKHV